MSIRSMDVDGGKGGGFDFIDDFFEDVQEGGAKIINFAETVVCNAWSAILPPQLQEALQVTAQEPWRGIWRGLNLTITSVIPLAVMPVTLPLTLFFYPILIWLETTRIAWMVFANCGSVTTTLRNEAKDVLILLDTLSPTSDTGKVFRSVLRMAGATPILDAYDEIAPKVKTLLNPIVTGQPVRVGDVVAFAQASYRVAGEPELSGLVTGTAEDLQALEGNIARELDKVGALSPNAQSVYKTSAPSNGWYPDGTSDEFQEMLPGAGVGTAIAVGGGLALALLAWKASQKK